MTFKSITIFERPGGYSVIGNYVHEEIKLAAELLEVPVIYYRKRAPLWTYKDSLFVAIGGDGTMLRAMDVSIQSTLENDTSTDVVGFNAGNVGFLTEDPNNIQPSKMIQLIWDSEYTRNPNLGIRKDSRLALATVVDGKMHYALNEFTFTPDNIAETLRYRIDINGRFVAEHQGSGCMVSTPTGSTAMALSAGGAIMVPTADAMQIVPIIPHTLSSRPVITSGGDVITLSSEMERVGKVVVASDGRIIGSFDAEAKIEVTTAKVPAYVWYTARRDFFNVLSTKLDW